MKTKTVILAVLLALALSFSAYARGGRAAVPADTLIVGVPAMPVNLDPSLANDPNSARVIVQIYNTLIHLNYDNVTEPSLAERWEWVDPANPIELRVFLRRGVRFHNGDELRASDVQFSLDRAAASPVVAMIANMIHSTRVVNDFEVIIRLDFPFVPFVHYLGHNALSIVSERAVREMGVEAHSRAPVGTGPYRLVNIVDGDRVELVRWDGFWGAPAPIQNLVFRFIPDVATRLIALETGEVHIALAIPPVDMPRVRNNPNLTLYTGSIFATHMILFNTQRSPFNDIRVRHAIRHALDMDNLVDAVFLGAWPRSDGIVNYKVWGSVANELPPFEFNPARARQLLAEAGFPNGFTTSIFIDQGNPQRADMAELMQHRLGAIGITMSIVVMEMGVFLSRTAAGDFDIMISSWNSVTGEADYGLFPVFHSSSWGAAGNRARYSNPEVDRLLDLGRRTTDTTALLRIFRDAQFIIHNDTPWIPMVAAAEIIGVRNEVRGFRVAPNQRHRYWTLSFR